MTRTKEELVPLTPGEIRMYSCGVTVYDLSHVGHAKMMIVFDVIARYLKAAGYRVTFVRNFTDIEDKIIRRANEEGVPAREISERYIAAFREDIAALGVEAPDAEPKATDHVAEMVALIERLVAGGYAYVMDGDVYFEVRRFPAYGKLSGKNLDELLAGARVDVDERKRDPRDFALWKAAKPDEPSWPSPWGPGRPGWHIEWSEERVEEAARALARLTRLVDDASALGAAAGSVPSAFAGFAPRFVAAMDDDFNTPQALGVLFDFARALSEQRDRGLGTPEARAGFVAGVAELVRLARVLGLLQRRLEGGGPPPEVERLVGERTEARARRDFRRSDELPAEIQRLGLLVEDTPGGPRLTRKSG